MPSITYYYLYCYHVIILLWYIQEVPDGANIKGGAQTTSPFEIKTPQVCDKIIIIYNYYATDNSVHLFHRIEYYTQIPL